MDISTFRYRFRSRLAIGVLLVLLTAVAWQLAGLLSNPVTLPLYDYVEYWSAGRFCASGQNPYAPDQLLSLQTTVGWTESRPLMMWNPPWTLPLVMLFGLMGFKESHLLWLVAQILLTVVGALVLCRLYRLEGSRLCFALLIAITFMPTIVTMSMSQITPLILLGFVGFLHCMASRGRKPPVSSTARVLKQEVCAPRSPSSRLDLFAGAAACLIAVKPHLAHLFWLGLLLWSIHQRRWLVPLGLVAGLTCLSAIALLFNPLVFAQYFDALRNHPPEHWVMPTLGTLLRQCFGWQHFWLQFLPPLAGGLWFLVFWWRNRNDWNWAERMPLIVIVSLLTSPYGAWTVDMIVLLIPVLQMISRRALLPAALVYAVFNGTALWLKFGHCDEFKFVWITPTLLLVYPIAMDSLRPSALSAIKTS